VVRTSLVATLIGLGLVAAVMEVQADLTPRDTQRAALWVQFDALWKAHVVAVDRALGPVHGVIAHSIGAVAAVRNAVCDALGTEVDTPLTPERVWRAMQAAATKK